MLRTPALLLVLLTSCYGIAAAGPGDPFDDPACNQIAALIDESAALSLPARVERAFMLTLRAAKDAAHDGQYARALILLRTFTFEVRGATRAKRLPAAPAHLLVARAEEVMGALGGGR